LKGVFGVAIYGFLPVLRQIPKGVLTFMVVMVEVDVVAGSFGFYGIAALVWRNRLADQVGQVLDKNRLHLYGKQVNSEFIDALVARKTPMGFLFGLTARKE
jgi:hypothetical protein